MPVGVYRSFIVASDKQICSSQRFFLFFSSVMSTSGRCWDALRKMAKLCNNNNNAIIRNGVDFSVTVYIPFSLPNRVNSQLFAAYFHYANCIVFINIIITIQISISHLCVAVFCGQKSNRNLNILFASSI